MVHLAPSWVYDVERGPDWLFVRLTCPPDNSLDEPTLADALWSLLEQHFTYRLVLECDDIERLTSSLVGQLIQLYRRIHRHSGVMRLCGLSDRNQRILENCRLSGQFPHFQDRAEAVLGHRPLQPR